jgi:UDP-N-acetylglucosamine 2-epimerase
MSHVASNTESLLNFESSIEKQLEASMLLGRQINLDKARQLAFTGQHGKMMEEILRQVGGEAEFNRMNVIQRKSLAESVGMNVEQLSRLVRNNAASGVAGVGAQVGAVMGDFNKVSAENSGKILDVAERQLDEQRKLNRTLT